MDEKIKENAQKIVDLLMTENPAQQNETIKATLLIIQNVRKEAIDNREKEFDSTKKEYEQFMNLINLQS